MRNHHDQEAQSNGDGLTNCDPSALGQFGCQGKGGGPWFANRRIGSLELTKRLEIGYKLEGHDGCVNALHFDPEGSLLASGSDDKVGITMSCSPFF